MPADSTQDNADSSRRKWIIILCVFLLLLAIFWSVDTSVFYILLSGVVFSFFRTVQLTRGNASESDYTDVPYEPVQSFNAEPSYQASRADSFLSSLSAQQKKTALVFILGFVGFIFFFVLVGTLIDLVNTSVVTPTAYQQKASDYYYDQQYDSAAYYYRLALQNDPENADLWFERGNAFLNNQNSDSAIVMYKRALEIKPDFEQAQYNIGYIFFDRKNYREAIDETKKILVYNPDYVDAKLLIGDSFYNRSQLDSALQYYESSYKAGYRSASLCNLMAYIYDTKGETTMAIDLYKEAIGQDSTITDIYIRLGELVTGEEGERFREKAAYLNAQKNQQ
jgi:tetratricopeptide (TPR) repeat protein